MQKGKLYRAIKGFILYRNIDPLWNSETEIKIETTTIVASQRKLRARWNVGQAQDFRAYCGVLTYSKVPVETVNYCEVPEDWVVMYIETGKTGDYKLMCGDFIGWTSQTLECLEEISNENDEEDTAVETQPKVCQS